jgi:phosphoribosyl 1,2-cyclic phosphodiesterase
VKLTFLGTRGGIIARSKAHYRNASLLISTGITHILIDRGTDWLNQPFPPAVQAILITHAHPDHSEGLKHGTPCPVIATKETWEQLPRTYAIQKRLIIPPYEHVKVGSLSVQAFPVYHSLRAPAVGYKIVTDQTAIFYVPDVAKIIDEKAALSNVDVYIGDGAIVKRTLLLRKKDHKLTGHAPIEEQVSWCLRNKISQAIFTHCGSEITKESGKKTAQKMQQLEKKYGMPITIAHDGMELHV